MEEQLHNNRMGVIANMLGQGGVPPGLGSDSSAAAIANLAMRLGVTQVCFKKYVLVNKIFFFSAKYNYNLLLINYTICNSFLLIT